MKTVETPVNPFMEERSIPYSGSKGDERKKTSEKKPKSSEVMKSYGQMYKAMKGDHEELMKAMHYLFQIVENFGKNPEEFNDRVKFALDMMEHICSKLRNGVDKYLENYIALKNEQMLINHEDEEEKWIVSTLRSWTCAEGLTLTKCFDSLKVIFDDDNFYEAIKNKSNINVVIKDGYGNIFGVHVACAPSQKHLAILDKTHFIFSLRNVKVQGSAEKQFVPKRMIESFVVFHKSIYVFCVPYAFAIGPYGKSAVSSKLENAYVSKGSQYPCSFTDINGTSIPTTFPIEWVKVFVQ